jgi:hypothetical protein
MLKGVRRTCPQNPHGFARRPKNVSEKIGRPENAVSVEPVIKAYITAVMYGSVGFRREFGVII